MKTAKQESRDEFWGTLGFCALCGALLAFLFGRWDILAWMIVAAVVVALLVGFGGLALVLVRGAYRRVGYWLGFAVGRWR